MEAKNKTYKGHKNVYVIKTERGFYNGWAFQKNKYALTDDIRKAWIVARGLEKSKFCKCAYPIKCSKGNVMGQKIKF
jgi:hypothetical protein